MKFGRGCVGTASPRKVLPVGVPLNLLFDEGTRVLSLSLEGLPELKAVIPDLGGGGAGTDGKDGANGKDGKDGVNGKDGKDGVNGKDGKDGVNGKDGINGTNGINGIDGKDGKDGVDGAVGALATDTLQTLGGIALGNLIK